MSINFVVAREEIEWAGRQLSLETGKIARQADGAVVARYGDTVVLCTVVAAKQAKDDIDFFPLTVHYQEKAFAAGRIPGGFFKREGKPSEKEVLSSRLIDRPIRPLFPEGFFNEVQVVCTVLSYDGKNDSDVVAMIGASAALAISGVPFLGPIACARVGYIDGEYILNPLPEQFNSSLLDLDVAGTEEGVLMVESEAHELSEEVMLGAVMFGHQAFQPIIKMIKDLKKKAGKEDWKINLFEPSEDIRKKVTELALQDLKSAYKNQIKQDRYAAINAVKQKVKDAFANSDADSRQISKVFEDLSSSILRGDILTEGKRVDGRSLTDIRAIECEVGILPRVHGSALFTRGETQALVVSTLGTAQDEQTMDSLEGEYKERFMLHYNFPSYSVGEVGRMSSPGRREIGHGKLAWRAINPVLPKKDQFPYTVRAVSEITESNGSSSMATVCGTSLSLMDAGVSLPRPVAGIAMGLIKEDNKFAVLSDILGDEDHLGDMDFKVAGTENGVTALQMDLKITSVNSEIMKTALAQARDGRLHILGEMAKAITTPRTSVNEFAPKMVTIQINKDKIREVIGPGGKVIREICERTGVRIDIDDEGVVTVSGLDQASIDTAIDNIKSIACEPEIGAVYTGKVVKVAEFGAFVNFFGARDGLVHVSEMRDERVNKVSDVVNVGDEVKVRVIGFDDRGKVKLSMKGF